MSFVEQYLAPFFAGALANCFLAGIVFLQYQTYAFSGHAARDPLIVKLTVGLLLIIAVCQTIFVSMLAYDLCIKAFGDFGQLLETPWSFPAVLALGALTSSIVKDFFAWRIYRLTHNKFIVSIVMVLSTVVLVSGLYVSAAGHRNGHWVAYRALRNPILIFFCTSMVCDLIIMLTLVWFLRNYKTGIKRTDNALTRMIVLFVQSGVLTSCFAIAVLILFLYTSTSLSAGVFIPLQNIYIISVMSSLSLKTPFSGAHSADTSPHVARVVRPGRFSDADIEFSNMTFTSQPSTSHVKDPPPSRPPKFFRRRTYSQQALIAPKETHTVPDRSAVHFPTTDHQARHVRSVSYSTIDHPLHPSKNQHPPQRTSVSQRPHSPTSRLPFAHHNSTHLASLPRPTSSPSSFSYPDSYVHSSHHVSSRSPSSSRPTTSTTLIPGSVRTRPQSWLESRDHDPKLSIHKGGIDDDNEEEEEEPFSPSTRLRKLTDSDSEIHFRVGPVPGRSDI